MALLAGKILRVSDLTSAIGSSQVTQASPGGNTDLTAASFTTYVINTTVTAPSWATKAQINVGITGLVGITAAGGYQMRLSLGGTTGLQVALSGIDTTNSPRFPIGWNDEITLPGTGSLAYLLQAFRSSGTGALRADTATDFTTLIRWIQ